MIKNLVVEASRHIVVPKSDEEALTKLLCLRESLLPIEQTARQELDERIALLKKQGRSKMTSRDLGLPMISPEIFGWKKGDLPTFAVFDIKGDGECVISTDPAKRKLPFSCRNFYDNVLQARPSNIERGFRANLMRLWAGSAAVVEVFFIAALVGAGIDWWAYILALPLSIIAALCATSLLVVSFIAGKMIIGDKEVTAKARLAGTLPEEVRAKVRQFEPLFKEIVIVSEATWELSVTRNRKLPAWCDPLALGWDGGNFFLISCFDTTSVEQYVSDEFSTNPEDA